MERKIKVFIIWFIILFSIFICIPQESMAYNWDFNNYSVNTTGPVANATKTIMATGIDVVQIIGLGIAVIMITMLAIKYMTGAAEDKASFQKSATIYVLGAVILFGASGILEIIQNFTKSAF